MKPEIPHGMLKQPHKEVDSMTQSWQMVGSK